jgi:uncharacterized protein YdhG (YjbR/CyaY superfamily)
MTAQKHFSNIDDYLDSFPEDVKKILQLLRQTILEELPQAKETISYNMPTFKIGDDSVIFFAAWKAHVSVYPFSMAMESIPEAKGYSISGKGTIQFSYDQPLPISLIRSIIRFRLDEIKKEKLAS